VEGQRVHPFGVHPFGVRLKRGYEAGARSVE